MNLEEGIPMYLDQTDLNSSGLHDNHPEVRYMYINILFNHDFLTSYYVQ